MDNQTLQLLLSFALTGVVIASVAQYTKAFLEKSSHRTWYVLGLSVIGGLIVYYGHLIPTNLIVTLVGIWASANTVYLTLKALGIIGSDPVAPTPVPSTPNAAVGPAPQPATPPPPSDTAAG